MIDMTHIHTDTLEETKSALTGLLEELNAALTELSNLLDRDVDSDDPYLMLLRMEGQFKLQENLMIRDELIKRIDAIEVELIARAS